ncbi:GrpB family protein [Hymenobacter fodinae]|uniref:GrpB family protein n=1 Tax=Hymenobacter fodinae TaxID=2510796 RepID=A0A4Z0PAA9_9BACT|nr:GrpB family protein [Hymenobacter fodinae]TGE09545.1 GrpB family protein [Hymenobacter fodinae]
MPNLPIFAPSRPVVIVPYQAGWAQEFDLLAQRLRAVTGESLLAINHIGSTAVPGLCAKDVLDVQLQVSSLQNATELVGRLQAAGFQQGEHLIHDIFHGLPADSAELEKRYMREPAGERRMHLHIREQGRFNTRYALLFRDYLRSQAPAREAYGELKLRAASLFPHSIDGYLYVKEPVFHLLYYAAELWAEQIGWTPAE